MSQEFKLPDLGEGVHEGQIIRLLVGEGDEVKEDQPLMEVETDKAAVEIPSPFAGVIRKWHVEENELVHVGDVMVTVDAHGESASDNGQSQQTAAQTATKEKKTKRQQAGGATATTTAAPPTGAPGPRRRKPASPYVRKLARQKGIDIETINGSGPGGRITRADIEQATTAAPSDTPSAPAARQSQPATTTTGPTTTLRAEIVEPPGTDDKDQHGPVRRHRLSQARKTIATNMAQSWSTIPHCTDNDDADITQLDALRQGHTFPNDPQRKLRPLPFVIRAVVRALQRYPMFNAFYDEQKQEITYRRYINIALGVQTERGLVAPVIREADSMGIVQLADAIDELTERARSGSFSVNDTRGGTFTVSNAGAMGGSWYSTPIITPGQSAVIALGRARKRPWVVDDAIVPRLIQPISVSFDHRIIDGADEIAFMQHIIADLENPARLVL